jgi:hypothetical protein
MSATEHSLYSSYREVLLEHLFSGEVMRYLWLQGVIRMEVLRPQVDDGGYDLVLAVSQVSRCRICPASPQESRRGATLKG